jgi:hypothetical protein
MDTGMEMRNKSFVVKFQRKFPTNNLISHLCEMEFFLNFMLQLDYILGSSGVKIARQI